MTNNSSHRLDRMEALVENLINANIASSERMVRLEEMRERDRQESEERRERDRQESEQKRERDSERMARLEEMRERDRQESEERRERDRQHSNERLAQVEQANIASSARMDRLEAAMETWREPLEILLEAATRHEAMISRLDAILERMIYREGRSNEEE